MLVTEGNFAGVCDGLARSESLYVDLETDGLDAYRGNRMVGIAACDTASDTAYYFPFRHSGLNLPPEYLDRLIRLLETKEQIGWNYPFDVQFLWREGMAHDVRIRDCMLDHHLLNENARSFALKTLAVQYISPDANAAERELESYLQAHLLTGKGDMWRLPAEKVERYACDDVLLTRAMDQFHRPHLEKQGLESVADGVARYALATSHMRRRGILVDVDQIKPTIHETRSTMMELWHRARDLAGRKINLDSPKDVGRWLGVKSTSEKALERMRQREEVKLILHYRKLAKGISGYYLKMRDMVDDENVLRCDIRLHGTISGRLAVRNPPLQSLPTDTDLYKVKRLLVARPGYKLVQADYSQAEIKVACHYGPEPAMASIVRSGKNMHDVVSADLAIERFAAKRLNFSVIYGIGKQSLARDLDITESAAQRYLSKYHARYPGFRRLLKRCEAFAKRNRYIDMYTGRRRHYNVGHMSPEHKASSNLIQGTVAEITRERQTELHEELVSHDIHQLLQVHDSAIMEVPEDRVEQSIPMIREIMEMPDTFSLPMTVDIGVGDNMEEAK